MSLLDVQVLPDKEVCEEEEGDKESPLTFPCPTCRTVITVPPGGVAQFQTNFYVNHEALKCNVCDKGQDAMYSCADCNQNMCSQCQRCHDKFTSNHQVRTLSSRCQEPPQNSLDPDWERKHNEQVKVLEAALDQMMEEEDTLQTQRQAVADAISRQADSVRALVSQAEERGQKALAEVTDMMSKQIHEEMATARGKHSRLWQGGATRQRGNMRTTLLADEDFQHYQQRNSKGRQPIVLLHQFDDSAVSMQAVEAYIGTVYKNTQPTQVTSCASKISLDWIETNPAETAEVEEYATSIQSNIVLLEHEMTDMKCKLNTLEEVEDSWDRTSTDVADRRKRENKIFEDNLEIIRKKLSALEENQLISDEVTKTLMGNMCSLQQDITFMRQELKSISGVYSELKIDINKIQKETLMTDAASLEKQIIDLRGDLASLKGKCNTRVAFYARLGQGARHPFSGRLTLIDVELNLGNAYNPSDGIFAAPVAGTYLFLATEFKNSGRRRPPISICSNSFKSVYSRFHVYRDELSENCVLYVPADLSAGAMVWLEARSRNNKLSGDTTFSGLLVQPLL